MKTGHNTIAFLAVTLAVIFALALVLPEAHTNREASNGTSSAAGLSEANALGAIILVRQVRVTKDDLKNKEEQQPQLAYVDNVLSRYE